MASASRSASLVASFATGHVLAQHEELVSSEPGDRVVAGVPLNVTVPEDPKFVPVIVTAVPTAPDVGFRLVIEGGGGGPDVVTVSVKD